MTTHENFLSNSETCRRIMLLPPDTHLRDGGHYRCRRHSCFTLDTASGELLARLGPLAPRVVGVAQRGVR